MNLHHGLHYVRVNKWIKQRYQGRKRSESSQFARNFRFLILTSLNTPSPLSGAAVRVLAFQESVQSFIPERHVFVGSLLCLRRASPFSNNHYLLQFNLKRKEKWHASGNKAISGALQRTRLYGWLVSDVQICFQQSNFPITYPLCSINLWSTLSGSPDKLPRPPFAEPRWIISSLWSRSSFLVATSSTLKLVTEFREKPPGVGGLCVSLGYKVRVKFVPHILASDVLPLYNENRFFILLYLRVSGHLFKLFPAPSLPRRWLPGSGWHLLQW